MNFNKYSKEQLGEAYKQIVGYNPFEDDADISKEEVIELMKGYDQAIEEEGSFGDTTFEQYFSSIKDENPVGKKAAIVAEKIIKKESDSSAVKKYKDDLLKKSSLIFDIVSETIGTFTLKHGKTEIRVPRDLVLVLNNQPGNISNVTLTKEIREKAYKILLPLKVGVKVSDAGNTITIEPSDYSRSQYKSKLDGMQIIYDLEKQEYEVSEYQAGPNKDELHIYKETPSLTVAIKDMLKGNGRKPIKIWDNDQSHKGAKIKGVDFAKGGEISDIKYYIKITPSDKRWPSHVWKEGGLFDTPEVAEQHASRIRKMKDEYDVRKKKYSKVEVLPINKKEIGNLFAAIDDVTAVNLYMSEKAGVGRNGNRLSEDELAERIINDYKSNRISASTLWRVLNDESLISGKKASYVYDQLGFIPFQGYPLIKKSNKEYVYDKGGLTPDSILDSSGEPSITAIQQQYYHRVSKALKSIAPNLELWKNFSIRDKDTNLVYRVDSFLFKRVGGKLQEIVFNYVHGQSSASIGELSIVFSSDEINANFESLGISKTEKFAWGGMAEKGGRIKDNVMQYGESIAEELIKNYLPDVKPNEVSQPSQFIEKGQYCLYEEKSKDFSDQCCIEVFCGDDYTKLSNAINSNYETFSSFLEKIAGRKNFNSEILTSDENETITFVLTNPRTSKFAWGGMAANVIGEKRARDIAKYFCEAAEKAGKEQEVVSLCKFAKDGFSVDLVLPCKEELNHITFRVALEDILRLRYYFDQFIPSKEQVELMKKNPDKFEKGGVLSNTLIAKAEKIVNYTNKRLKDWYKNAKEDYGIEGNGKARFDKSKNAIVIDFTEDGKNYTYEELSWQDEAIDYTFNVWMENEIEELNYARGGNVFNTKLIVRPEYKYQNIAKSWLEDNDENSLRYKIAVMLLNNEHNIDEKINININLDEDYDRYLRILRGLASITESKHEMSFRTNNVSIADAERWAKEKLNEIFVLSDSYAKGGLADIFDKTIGQALYFLETEKHFSVKEVKSRTRQDRKYDVFDSDSKFVKTLSRNEVVDFAKEQGFKFEHGGKVKKHDIYNDTPLAPAIIADYVAKDSFEKNAKTKNLPLDDKRYNLEQQLSSYLDERAIKLYKHNEHFRKQINQSGNKGRDKLYSFMYHWAEAWIGSLDKNFKPSSKYQDGGSVSVQPGDRVAFKDTGSIVRIDRESGDLMVRDASGNTQSIPKSRILEKFKYGGISRK